jgi:uncharacterized protein YqcC (DUF446 family)
MPFNHEAQQKLLESGGDYSLFETVHNIHIGGMTAHFQGNGFGKTVMREVVKGALEKEKTVSLDAVESSHIFHLYMGMIPKDRKESYVAMQYGRSGSKALTELRSNSVENLNPRTQKELFFILSEEKQLLKDQSPTTEELSKNRCFLLELDKNISYLTYQFIPSLLKILSNNLNVKCPDTTSLASVQMELSKEGKERWAKALSEQTEFDAFKKFEQLLPFMTEPQKEELAIILTLRSKALALETLSINFSNKHTEPEIESYRNELLQQVENLFQGIIQFDSTNKLTLGLIAKKEQINIAAQTQKSRLAINEALTALNEIGIDFSDKHSKPAIESYRSELLQQAENLFQGIQFDSTNELKQTFIAKKVDEINIAAQAQQERLAHRITHTLAPITEALTELSNKIGKVHQHTCRKAFDESEKLLRSLNQSYANYYESLLTGIDQNQSGDTFKQECSKSIADAKLVLSNDLDWGPYLNNLLKKLTNSVINFASAGRFKGGFFNFNITKSASVEAIEAASNSLLQHREAKDGVRLNTY